tara:strand:+ start:363 stop:617 length:255 start_codon:yes stop_codon:yes gene_type:complete
MPIRTREYSLYEPGRLIMCSRDLYSSTPIDGDHGLENNIPHGTVGIILAKPKKSNGSHYHVQFVGGIKWYVLANEIEPYIEEIN